MPCPPPGDLPIPGIELRPPAWQAHCCPAELPRKPQTFLTGMNTIGTNKSRIPKAQFGDLRLTALPGVPGGVSLLNVDAAGRLGLVALAAYSINKIT